jgi:hypothetical protein
MRDFDELVKLALIDPDKVVEIVRKELESEGIKIEVTVEKVKEVYYG